MSVPNENQKWRPTFGEIVAIGALVAAAIMWLKQPNWEWGLPITAVLVALVIFTAVRHQSHPIRRAIVAAFTIAILIWAASGPIWKSFLTDYPTIAFQSPITFHPPAQKLSSEPPDLPLTNLPGPPLSKWGKVMFLCQPPNVEKTLTKEQAIAQLRRNADIYGKALGVELVINEIPYGIRFDLTANSTEGKQLLEMARRFTVQMERASNGIFITFSLDYLGAFAVLSNFPMEREMGQAKVWMQQTENMGFPHGTCQML